ncbi:MAG: methionyl-tRNA formyltransferase [Anaerolineales bacterium]|nr:methionyl-tRNA formyltransferase [Anaerolineales bacterium]
MAESREPTVVLAGSVNSSLLTLRALVRHRLRVVGILGLAPAASAGVSGYVRMDSAAAEAGIPYADFKDLNAPETAERVRRWAPDVFFIVGLSQMVKKDLLAIPRLGCVGFHPTRLPEARGRAPVAWMVLEGRSGAATFFQMDERADAGPILVQEPFAVDGSDYSADVTRKLEAALDAALERWLPALKRGEWKAAPQEEANASYTGKRTPEDGVIHWEWPAKKIHALVRAASRPYPGAFTFVEGRRLVVWKAEPETELPYRGVVGRIVHREKSKGWLVQTGNGLLWLTETEFDPADGREPNPKLRIGTRLGGDPESEIPALRKRVQELEERLRALENAPNRKDS